MNDHAVPHEAGGHFWEFGGKRTLRETARWVAGVSLAGAGAAIAVIGTASQTYLSMPLGIAITVLGAIVLVLHVAARNKTRHVSAPGRTGRRRTKSLDVETATVSVASELALLADLYSQGALTVEEFAAAKRRVLGI